MSCIYDIVYGPKIAPNFDNLQQNFKDRVNYSKIYMVT